MFLGLGYKLSILFECIGILTPEFSFPKGPCLGERGASFYKMSLQQYLIVAAYNRKYMFQLVC